MAGCGRRRRGRIRLGDQASENSPARQLSSALHWKPNKHQQRSLLYTEHPPKKSLLYANEPLKSCFLNSSPPGHTLICMPVRRRERRATETQLVLLLLLLPLLSFRLLNSLYLGNTSPSYGCTKNLPPRKYINNSPRYDAKFQIQIQPEVEGSG